MAIFASTAPFPATSLLRVHPMADGAMTASLAIVTLLVDHVVKDGLYETPSCRVRKNGSCDPRLLSAFDRFSVPFEHQRWRRTSDGAQWAAIVGGALLVGADAAIAHPLSRGPRVARHLLVYTKALFCSQAVALGAKMAVRRPRPVAYRQAITRFEDLQSFPSAHTSIVAAAGAAAASLWCLRRVHPRQRLFAASVAAALIAVTAIGRVLGGQHFLSDVIAGAVIGAASGVSVVQGHIARSTTPPIR